jgi:hypothetical protein
MAEAGRDVELPALAADRRRRRGPPGWGVLLFLALLGGLFVLNSWVSMGGQPVRWIENDLNAALAQARTQGRRVFLYIYDPNDPAHLRNERQIFSQRYAREPLQNAVCCRVQAQLNDLVALKYRYEKTPLFLVLKEDGREMFRTQGAVDERQFMTYVGSPLAAKKP